jgi:Flp pilus assembly protein TadD
MKTQTTSRTAMRNAVTGVLSFVLLAGCTMGDKPAPSQVSAADAKQMLANGQTNGAIDAAEAAVLASPRTAQYRAGLGNAYLQAGRFEAAATSYADARVLGDDSARTALSLALAKIGGGRGEEALKVLAANRDKIPAGDLGLAVSLAGDPRGGIQILTDALRTGRSTAKLRQNLAYSYALAGQWREARVMAAEDVPADQVGKRMAQWAQTARPDLVRHRVAALIDAPVVADPGQPQQLALHNYEDAVQFAREDAADAPLSVASAEPIGVEARAAMPRPAPLVAAARPAAAPARSRFVSNPVIQAIPSRMVASRSVAAPRAEVARASTEGNVPKAGAAGSHVIQLGSFTSRARAEKAWSIYLARNPELDQFERVITPAKVRGKLYYRVQAAGFDRAGAKSMCSTVKRNGEGCLAYADPRGGGGAGGPVRARR